MAESDLGETDVLVGGADISFPGNHRVGLAEKDVAQADFGVDISVDRLALGILQFSFNTSFFYKFAGLSLHVLFSVRMVEN